MIKAKVIWGCGEEKRLKCCFLHEGITWKLVRNLVLASMVAHTWEAGYEFEVSLGKVSKTLSQHQNTKQRNWGSSGRVLC
jgi:hypothetical protein